MKGYECEISIGDDDEIYHLYMDDTVYGDKTKLTKLFEKIVFKFWTDILDYFGYESSIVLEYFIQYAL